MTNTFLFPPDESLVLGGDKAKFDANVQAIQLARTIVDRPATPDEQQVLSHYTGWGSTPVLNYAFPDTRYRGNVRWNDASPEIAALHLSDVEIRSMRASSLNAHYTELGVIRAMWKVLAHLGIGKIGPAKILEPSAGIGHFFSAMPHDLAATSKLVGIELDKLTYDILKLLHPEAVLHNCGFEATQLPGAYFDVAMSNIPFGDYPVVDVAMKSTYLKAAIHDYFFAKAIETVRPGGIVMFITSRYTMDKTDPRLREWIAERADLLGMVRLPDDAFMKNAGTKVVTDIIVLRKKNEQACVGQTDWTATTRVKMDNRNGDGFSLITLNQAYAQHPEWVLGTPVLQHGMYGDDAYTVHGDGRDLEQTIADVLISIVPQDIMVDTPHTEVVPVKIIRPMFYVPDSAPAEYKFRTAALQRVYDTAKELLTADIDEKIGEAAELRLNLNREYDSFVVAYGCINSPANVKFFTGNPALPFLRALESNYDPLAKGSDKATLFQRSTVRGNLAAQGWAQMAPVERAQEALITSLDKRGKVDIRFMAKISGDTSKGVTAKLAGRIFKEPTGDWVTASEYLSGNVVKKLADARNIAAIEPETYSANVAELMKIQPAPLGSGDVIVRMGAPWIPATVINDFLKSIIQGYDGTVTHVPSLAEWHIRCNRHSYALNENDLIVVWGSERMDAIELAECILNMKQPVVYDTVDEKQVINQTATVVAQAQAAKMKDRFATWAWQDSDRSKLLCAIYNQKFNCLRPRTYDGIHLTLRGLNNDIILRKHQLDAIWRAMQSKAVLLGHVVGAGKTLCMVCAAMELLRIGLVHKGLVVVPNHLTEQWAAEILRAYPNANILVASRDDMAKLKRGEFMSKIATNSWDIVVMPMSQFRMLPMSVQAQIDYVEGEMKRLEEALSGVEDDDHVSRKTIEKHLKRMDATLRTLLAMKKDSTETITWEELGIDLLMVDEWHNYKNLFFATKMTRVPGLPNSKSQRATDMYMKVRYTLDKGGRVICATGTPVANTLAEVYTMMRYLQLELLQENGIDTFDAWAQTLAEVIPILEMTPDGSGFRLNSRFAKFVNLPELATMWRQVLDVKNADQLNLPSPKLHTGRSIVVATPGSQGLKEYIQKLVERVEKIRTGCDPRIDNMLKVTGDGRKAALDMRLVDSTAHDDPGGKINGLVSNVTRIWEGSKARKGAQLIFCDLGTPKKIRPVVVDEETVPDPEDIIVDVDEEQESVAEATLMKDVYNEIKAKLIRSGVEASEIAFIHDCKTPGQRSELFASVREGHIRVLIGSTEKMGTGMNVQNLLIALHDLDAPWRPADIEQRHGRMMRQGNEYPEVAIFNYVTEGSFDGYVWQTLETKARFISQIMAGEITARTAEDVGEMVLSMSAVKALASGNPKVMQRVAVEMELTKMSHIMPAWRSSKANMQYDLTAMPASIVGAEKEVKLHGDIFEAFKTNVGDFSIELVLNPKNSQTVVLTKREDAGKQIRELAEACYQIVKHTVTIDVHGHKYFEIGAYKGMRLLLKAFANPAVKPEIWPAFGDDMIEFYSATVGDSDIGVIQSLEAQLRGSEKRLATARERLAMMVERQTLLEVEVSKPWENAEKYLKMQRQLAILDIELAKASVSIDTGGAELFRADQAAEVTSTFSILEIMDWLRELHYPTVTCNVIDTPLPIVESQNATPELARPNSVEPDEKAIEEQIAKINDSQAKLIFGVLQSNGIKKRAKTYVVPESQAGFGW